MQNNWPQLGNDPWIGQCRLYPSNLLAATPLLYLGSSHTHGSCYKKKLSLLGSPGQLSAIEKELDHTRSMTPVWTLAPKVIRLAWISDQVVSKSSWPPWYIFLPTHHTSSVPPIPVDPTGRLISSGIGKRLYMLSFRQNPSINPDFLICLAQLFEVTNLNSSMNSWCNMVVRENILTDVCPLANPNCFLYFLCERRQAHKLMPAVDKFQAR